MDGPTQYDLRQNEVNRDAQEARDFVDNIQNLFNQNITQMVAAMSLASREYDRILSLQAAKPLFGEIFWNLVVTVIPWINIVEKVGKKYSKLGEKYKDRLETINDTLNDLIGSVRTPHNERSDHNQNQSLEQNRFAASNSAIKEEMSALFDSAEKMNEIVRNAKIVIAQYQQENLNSKTIPVGIKQNIKTLFESYGLAQLKIVSDVQFNILTEQMTYDLLKKYVSTYATVRILDFGLEGMRESNAIKSKLVVLLPTSRDDGFFSNINLNQRLAIYQKFGSGKNAYLVKDRFRPPIESYIDLIRFWGLKAISVRTKREIKFIDVLDANLLVY